MYIIVLLSEKVCIHIVFPCVLLHFHSFPFSNYCGCIVGTGVVLPAARLSFEVSGTHFEECYVITVLWFVT